MKTMWLPASVALALAAASPASAQSFGFHPANEVVHGQPVTIRLSGLKPKQMVEITAERRFGRPSAIYRSAATFRSDAKGRLDLRRAAATSGSYLGVEAAGLFWSMRPVEGKIPEDWRSGEIRLTAAVSGHVIATGMVKLVSASPQVTVEDIPGFPAAQLFRLPGNKLRPVIVILHGADGNTGASERFGRKIVSLGYAVAGLPYYSPDWGSHAPPKAIPALPGSFVDIRIDQIADLRNWLGGQQGIDTNRIALLGGSKGAEFALIAASKYPWLTSVVAFSPSDLVWEGWGLQPVEAEGTRSSFSYAGKPLAFMPYVGFSEGLLAGPNADLLKIHENGRVKFKHLEAAARIKLEDFQGEVMLVAGVADMQWRSAAMARNLAADRSKAGLRATLLLYPDAGHDVAGDGCAPTIGEVARGGGSAEANAKAQRDAWPKILKFLKQTLRPE